MSLPEAPAWAVVAMTAPDLRPTDEELRAAVHEVVDQFVRAVEDDYGPIPSLSSERWWTAPPMARLFAVLVAGEAWLVHDPDRAAAERPRQLPGDLAGAWSWSQFARHHVSHSELERRRAEAGPLAVLRFDPAAAARWVETGRSDRGAA